MPDTVSGWKKRWHRENVARSARAMQKRSEQKIMTNARRQFAREALRLRLCAFTIRSLEKDHPALEQMTADSIARIQHAIAECDLFIVKEQARSEATRPGHAQETLNFYLRHRARLVEMLDTGILKM